MKKLPVIFVILLILSGCKTRFITQEVPVVVEHTTHEKSTELRVDTIFQHDSTIVMMMGDTLVERYYNTIYKVHEVVRGDTLHDTIPKIVTVTKQVMIEKQLHWHQKALMLVGGATLISLALWLVYRFRKR